MVKTRALIVLAYIAGVAVFAHTVAFSATSGWPTYQHDAGRSGLDANQAPISSIAPAWTTALDGPVYAQPLVSGTTVYAATENNTVYALDSSQNGAQLWHQHLAAPVSLGQLPCGNIDPYGITGTPVIDTVANLLYVVALQSSPSIHHELYALNTAAGAGGSVIYHYPIDAPNTDPKIHGQRGALTLANNKVYVVYSGRAGDCGAYVGRIVGVNAGDTTGASLVSYALTSTTRGGIWAAAAADASGNVYVASGNSGATGSVPDRGESVVKLSPTLQELDFFTAPEWSSLNAGDLDIGSIGPMLLQNGWILQSGKNGMGYLINSASMGHVGGQLFEGRICPSGQQAVGFGAYLAPGTVFIPCSNSLMAVHVNTSGPPGFTVATIRAGYSGGQASSPPILVGGVLWNLDRGAALLLGFDPNSGQQLFSAPLPQTPNAFAAPGAAAGQVLVPAGNAVTAFLVNGGAGAPPTSTPTATRTPTLVATSTPTATPVPATATPTSAPAGGGSRGGGGGGGGAGGGGSRSTGGASTIVNIGPAGGGGGAVVPAAAPPTSPPNPPPTPTAVPVVIQPATAVPETQIQTAGAAVAAAVTALIDPGVGGNLTTPDQALSVEVPPGAEPDVLSLSLIAADPSAAANIDISGQLYALTVVDSAGDPATTFLQPVSVVWTPPPGTDPNTVSISTLDAIAGTLQTLPTQVTADGRVLGTLTSLAPPANLQPLLAPPAAPPPLTDTTVPNDAVPPPDVAPPPAGDSPAPDAGPPDAGPDLTAE